MEEMVNRKIVLINRPDGMPKLSDFRLEEVKVEEPEAGHVVVATDVLSIDAFIRTTLETRAYHGVVPIGAPIVALGVGHVLHSTVPEFQPGDEVFGPLCAQTVTTLPSVALRKLDTSKFPATAYLGALGMTTGLTAYFGITEVGAVKPGDTVVVSGAAGAVGSLAGQIARISGATNLIGIAGGPEKVAFLVNELGFTAAIDYKNENVEARLAELAPDGIDVFFDNVGGSTLDAALMHIKEFSRVVICGGISHYEDMDNVVGPKNYLKLAERHARMEGFAVTHFGARFPEAEAALTGWLQDGQLIVHEQYEHGIERFPEALLTLLTGGNRGKMLLDLR